MTAKAKIRVIKKGEMKAAEKSAIPAAVENSTKKQAAREMVSTVTTWVTDFQHRKREETRQAIETFFSTQPQKCGA